MTAGIFPRVTFPMMCSVPREVESLRVVRDCASQARVSLIEAANQGLEPFLCGVRGLTVDMTKR